MQHLNSRGPLGPVLGRLSLFAGVAVMLTAPVLVAVTGCGEREEVAEAALDRLPPPDEAAAESAAAGGAAADADWAEDDVTVLGPAGLPASDGPAGLSPSPAPDELPAGLGDPQPEGGQPFGLMPRDDMADLPEMRSEPPENSFARPFDPAAAAGPEPGGLQPADSSPAAGLAPGLRQDAAAGGLFDPIPQSTDGAAGEALPPAGLNPAAAGPFAEPLAGTPAPLMPPVTAQFGDLPNELRDAAGGMTPRPLREDQTFPQVTEDDFPLADAAPSDGVPADVAPPAADLAPTANVLPGNRVAFADQGPVASALGTPSEMLVAAPAAGEGDAVKEYSPIFVDWPKPEFTLFLSGRQDGYIEPCGCSGLKNQKGGINRKYTLLTQLKEKGWNPIGLDVGGQSKRLGPQANIKFHSIIEAYRKMGYQAVGFGPTELGLTELVNDVVAGNPPFVCANVNAYDINATHRVIQVGSRKIGVTAVLGESMKKKVHSNDGVTVGSATDGLAAVWPKLKAAEADLYVLLAHASLEETKALAAQFPGFQIVVTAGGYGEPAAEPELLNDGRTMMVEVGTKGMFVSTVGYFGPGKPLRYQRVTLDARFKDAQPMLDIMRDYQKELEAAGLSGLALKPVPHPSGRTFVGSKACIDCHEDEYDIWKKTPHAHALQTLITPPERYNTSRHFDPECIACHVVGWEPQKYFPFKSGYLGVEETPKLHNVGCENCHGPGSTHVDAEYGDIDATDEQIELYRKQVTIKLDDAEDMCKQCHDLDNSPDFHEPGAFEKYWEKVEH
jgi:hypothetical protein